MGARGIADLPMSPLIQLMAWDTSAKSPGRPDTPHMAIDASPTWT